jgi:DNA-directed RNA polymerase subunit beta
VIRQNDNSIREHNLRKYQRSNQSTCIDQRPAVSKGQIVHKGDVIVDSSSTEDGKLALGQNVLAAFVAWKVTTLRTRSSFLNAWYKKTATPRAY